MEIKTGTTKAEILPLLRDVLQAKLFVAGRLAKPIFRDVIKTRQLDPIAAICVAYSEQKPIAWTVRTTEDWRTGCDDSEPRTENEIWWRFTSPEHRNKGICTNLKEELKQVLQNINSNN
jgi:hypothetical protein